MTTQDSNRKKPAKRRIGYGVGIPIISLEDSINIITKVSETAGLDGSEDALSTVMGNSIKSSTYRKKVGALRNYGLLAIENGSYSCTALARRIVQPTSSYDEVHAIFETFQNLEILNNVWNQYKGKILPQREFLANVIVRKSKIPQKLKLEWADYFISAAKFTGLLHERETGSFQVFTQPKIEGKGDYDDHVEIENPIVPVNKKEVQQVLQPVYETSTFNLQDIGWGLFSQRKVSGNRQVIFAIPDELTEDDISKIKIILKGIEASLDGLKKE